MDNLRIRTTAGAAAVLAVALTFAGCGSSSHPSSAKTSAGGSTTSTPGGSATASPTTSDGAGTTAPAETSASSTTTSPGSSGTGKSSGGALSIQAAGRMYAAAANRSDSIIKQLEPKLDRLGNNATGTDLYDVLKPYAKSVAHLHTLLASTHWPEVAASDAKSLSVDAAQLVQVMESLTTTPSASLDNWLQNFEALTKRSKATSTQLRKELHLPPAGG